MEKLRVLIADDFETVRKGVCANSELNNSIASQNLSMGELETTSIDTP
jgi:hypothetical protein